MLNASSNELLLGMQSQIEALTEEVKRLTASTTPAVIKGIQGIADFLGISKSVAQKMKNEGVIPCIQYEGASDELCQALISVRFFLRP